MHLEEAGAAHGAVDVYGTVHAGDAVLAERDDGAAFGLGFVEKGCDGRVEVGGGPVGAWVVGPEALRVQSGSLRPSA